MTAADEHEAQQPANNSAGDQPTSQLTDLTRRTFLQGVAGAGAIGTAAVGTGAFGTAALSAAAYGRVIGANERVNVGFIGFGLIGKRHVLDFQAQADVRCAAVAEAHRGRLEEARATIGGGEVRGHADFRKLLDQKDIDAVVVSTPDHWHAPMTMLACAAGKDVYVEKPVSLFVREGRWMADAARRHERVVQVGTQQRSGLHYERARQLIASGQIGRVHAVRMHAFRNIMPGFGSPADGDAPAELDWEMFLGPAPRRRYNPQRGIYHFRWFWDTAGGQMTNLGHHALDIVQWVLGAVPTAVASCGGRFALQDNGETPDTQDALFELADGKGTAVWSHREAAAGEGKPSNLEFCGTKGSLSISRKGFTITPDKKVPPQNRIPRFTGAHPVGGPMPVEVTGPDEFWTTPLEDKSGDEREQFTRHVRNFIDCVKSRATPVSDIESGHRVSTMCHLANISLRLGRKLNWDAARELVVGDEAANAMLSRPYREPWERELKGVRG